MRAFEIEIGMLYGCGYLGQGSLPWEEIVKYVKEGGAWLREVCEVE